MVNQILDVASGNKELLIDLENQTKVQLAVLIFFAIALGAFAGTYLATKV